MKKIVYLFFILSICLFILCGCSVEEASTLQDKNIAELDYIEGKLVTILNKMVKGEYIIEEKIEKNTNTVNDEEITSETIYKMDWEELLKDTRKIEDSLATVLVDLAALNIEAGEIAKLSNGVNNMIVAIGNEDERAYLIELNNVYALIPTYMEKYASNEEKTLKKRLKYYTISTYVAYTDGNLEMAKTQINELDKLYSEKMKDMAYAQNNEYNLNKLYVLIQELKKAVEVNNKDLVESKYLLTINEI